MKKNVKKSKRNRKVNKRKRILKEFILSAFVMFAFMFMFIELISYPEKYLTTWRYQLKNDIKQGDEKAIQYYEDTYKSKGIVLPGFEEI